MVGMSVISTPWLKSLLILHREPIKVVVFDHTVSSPTFAYNARVAHIRLCHQSFRTIAKRHQQKWSWTIPNLGVGFALRCFQRLSLPNIATRRFTWWQSR